MTDIPVKALSEIEVKSEVSDNDKILILDSETEEARLASKDELKGDKGDKGDKWDKWDKGDKGDKGETWATWQRWPQWVKGDKWDKWDTWATGSKWDKGDKWDTGTAATVTVGTTTTWDAWTSASVTNSWTSSAAVLDFTIPKWAKGDTGTAATIEIWTTTTWEPWTDASVTNSGTSSAAVFNFTIPKWEKWDTWSTWTAATITVWTTTTGDAGTSASVTNSGTSSAAVLDFTIPKWDKGATWETWATWNWISSVTTSKSWKTTTVTMNYTSWDPTVFQVQDGADWQGSWDMNASTYDPTSKMADAFDYTNMYNTPTLWTAASKDTWTTSWTIPVLDSNWKIDSGLLPSIAITDTFTVSTTSWLTGLSDAKKWDIAIVTTDSETYILSADPYSTASNWKKLATPTDAVTSVNSKTWAVTLNADDISDSSTTNKFVTASDLTNLWNLSGVNTWDQTASDFDIKDLTDSTDLRTTWSSKQDALSTQTAYSSKGTATKVPTITTNTLWQVTAISETDITFPVTSVGWSTWEVGLKTINNTAITWSWNISVWTLTAETVASGDSWTTYTIKVSSTEPWSWTPATTITFVTA